MIRVRPYRPEDRATTALVFYRTVRKGAAGHYSPVQRQDWAHSPEPDLSEPDPRAGQATRLSEACGRVTAFVLPEVMGRGHAAALYDGVLEHARTTGLARLTAHASHYSGRFLARRGGRLDGIEDFASEGGVQGDRALMSLDPGGVA